MNLKELRQKRLKWVEANRENGFEDGIKRLLTDLYPDNAHFIYELLQNAEDAQATEVCFILKEDSVEFEHNGDRLFSFADVESITSIGDSTKREDPTNIGKFGIGFKAVFAYTATPEIASGEFHFRIRDLVVPDRDGLAPCSHKKKETRFTFPFDNPQKPPQKARAEIEKNLRQLDESTLLFLSNIRKIEYWLPDGTLGFLERRKTDESRIEILVQHPEDSEPDSVFFLRFEKEVSVNDENDQPKPCRIAVAFGLEKTQTRNLASSDGWKIKRLDPGQVCIYFPAEKETSNLRFHLHAPFASTVARDSVRDCPANDELRDHLADLIAESMTTIRDQGLLTVGFLAVLPNERDNLSPFYTPIMKRLIRTFQQENLTPMKQGGHKAANGIFRGSARLSDLISDNDLATLLGGYYSPPLWISNPPQRNQREDNFLSMLDIKEVTPKMFAQKLSKQFLASQDDEWFIKFYEFLSDQKALWRAPLRWSYESGVLRNKPILRLQDGRHVNPFRYDGSPNAYWAAGTDTETSLPIVKVELSRRGEVRQFLEALGIPKLDLVEEVIETILPKYNDTVDVSIDENKRDLLKIAQAYLTDSQDKKSRLVQQLEETPFILAECARTGKPGYRKPEQVYFGSDELRMYFCDNESFTYVKPDHPQSALFRDLGVKETVRIRKREQDSQGYISIERYRGSHKRGLNGFDPDMHVDGLECAISHSTPEKSAFIWNEIAIPHSNCIRGIIEKSTRQTYENSEQKEQLSKFGKLLIETAWLPDSNGEMHKPRDLFYFDDLPESFDRDERLADQLDMKKNVVAKLAEEAGISETNLKLAKQIEESDTETREKIEVLLQGENNPSRQQKIPFTEALSKTFSAPGKSPSNDGTGDGGSTSNPSRRREKTQENIASAIESESELGERFTLGLRKKWKGKDDEVRVNFVEWYSGQCQICEKTFIQRNGEPYFEGLYLVSRINAEWIDRVGNVLCLCAEHSAMFQFGPKEVDEDIIHQVLQLKVEAEGGTGHPAIRMKLCGDPIEIEFAEKHLIDLQEMIKVSQTKE